MNENTFPEMLTIAKVAERSGLSEYAVRKLARSRQGRSFTIKLGTKYLINWGRFSAFFNCEAQEPMPDPCRRIRPVQIEGVGR